MTTLLSPNNQLFQLARSGQRLPHLLVALILSIVFVIAAQITGGSIAIVIIMLLSITDLAGLDLNNSYAAIAKLVDTAFEKSLLLILLFGPVFIILWGWLTLVEKRPLWTIGLERSGALWKYGRGMLVGLLMFIAAIGLSAIFGFIAIEENNNQLQGLPALGGVLLLFIGWFVQGPAEEAIGRGWLLPVIGARYKPWLGVLLSSLIFAIFHLLNPNLSPVAIINLFLFGLFTALYALYEGGLWGVFSIHTVWNWAQGNIFGFEVSGNPSSGVTLFNLMETGPDLITGGPFGPEGGLSVTAVLIVSCLAVWWANKRNGGNSEQP